MVGGVEGRKGGVVRGGCLMGVGSVVSWGFMVSGGCLDGGTGVLGARRLAGGDCLCHLTQKICHIYPRFY